MAFRFIISVTIVSNRSQRRSRIPVRSRHENSRYRGLKSTNNDPFWFHPWFANRLKKGIVLTKCIQTGLNGDELHWFNGSFVLNDQPKIIKL